MRADVFVYLSGPMTARDGHTFKENVDDAVAVLVELLSLGLPCFCPHLAGASYLSRFALDEVTWLQYDLAVLTRCTHVLLLPRWRTSPGSIVEMTHAVRLGLPLCYTIDDLVARVAGPRPSTPAV